MFSFFKNFFRSAGNDCDALAAALNALPDAAFLLDATDRVLKTNAAGCALLGDSGESQTLAGRLGNSELFSLLKKWREGRVTAGALDEITLRRSPANDVVLKCSCGAVPAKKNGAGGALLFVVLRDVTPLRRLENFRREFVANISHDLRTPVTVLKGYADTLFEDYASLDETARRQFVERLRRNANRLHRLLEDMLLLATLENNETALNLQRGVLNNLLREVVDLFVERFADAGAEIILDTNADSDGPALDPTKFLRVFQNLLENALRHAKGFTRIRISTTKDSGNNVIISVADDGVGVAQADSEKIFERFFRADKSRTGSVGTGLGLSIAKHLVLLHGGTIEALPNRPRGLIMRITLPA